MKKYIISSFIIITLCSSIFAQQTFTLQDAITAALNKNTSLIKQQNNLATQSAAVKSAYGNLLPNLNAGGSWNWSRVTDKKLYYLIHKLIPGVIPYLQEEMLLYSTGFPILLILIRQIIIMMRLNSILKN